MIVLNFIYFKEASRSLSCLIPRLTVFLLHQTENSFSLSFLL